MAHLLAQAPQLLTSLLRSASQPFTSLPSQLPNPGKQESRRHMLFPHEVRALARLELGQVQEPYTHTRPCAHTRPHWPQLLASLVTSRSQPFCGSPSQSPQFTLHCATTHLRFTHVDLALGRLQLGQVHIPALHTRPG